MATATVIKGKTKMAQLKVGSVLSETQFYKVTGFNPDGTVELDVDSDPNGKGIQIGKTYIEKYTTLADFFLHEEGKSRTEVIQIFLANRNTAMVVNFNKKVDPKLVRDEIVKTVGETAPKDWDKQILKSVNKALEGEERTATGYHFGSVDEFGRVSFIDMDKDRGTKPDWDARLIKVDPRTINWLIVNEIKYNVK